MKYHVRIYGDPVLREKSLPVDHVRDDLKQLAMDMIVTMRENNGAGLAAQQIGRTESVCVIDVDNKENDYAGDDSAETMPEMPIVLFNPEIVETAGDQDGQEGCLSFPEVYINVNRAATVTVEYMDLESRKCTLHAGGLLARAIQHEVDHLNGVLLVDHMTPVQKVAVSGKLKRMKKKS